MRNKMIDAAIKGLDWNLIMDYYKSDNIVHNGKKTKTTQTKFTIDSVKKELKDLINFVIDSNADQLHHDQWIIFWKCSGFRGEKNDGRLEVIFAPTRGVGNEKDETVEAADVLDIDEMEREALENLLEKNLMEEEYELCAIIRDRLKLNSKKKAKVPKKGEDI